jgi:hypothetical protein
VNGPHRENARAVAERPVAPRKQDNDLLRWAAAGERAADVLTVLLKSVLIVLSWGPP